MGGKTLKRVRKMDDARMDGRRKLIDLFSVTSDLSSIVHHVRLHPRTIPSSFDFDFDDVTEEWILPGPCLMYPNRTSYTPKSHHNT